MIIGLAGYAQSGKDSAAKTLVEEHGFTRLAFADRLRECVYALNPTVEDKTAGGIYQQRLQHIVDHGGWDNAKTQYPEVRRLVQVFGTEVGRQLIDPDIWLNAVRKQIRRGTDYVITDVRFLNELEAVHSWGGRMWHIIRPGIGVVNGHSSENALDGRTFDGYIENRGSLEDLADNVTWLLTNERKLV